MWASPNAFTPVSGGLLTRRHLGSALKMAKVSKLYLSKAVSFAGGCYLCINGVLGKSLLFLSILSLSGSL